MRNTVDVWQWFLTLLWKMAARQFPELSESDLACLLDQNNSENTKATKASWIYVLYVDV